jgi:hypothetical protein
VLERAMQAGTALADEAIPIVVNHGRWVVECPDCGSAQLGCRSDHRFMCSECANVVIGGLWRRVVWPKHAAAIEDELAERPWPKNQNWTPGETVADLRAERAVMAGLRG